MGPVRQSLRGAMVCVALLASACGEPAIDVDLPPRDGAHVADLAGILNEQSLESLLAEYAADGVDIVALTYETPVANCGEAFRAGQQFVAEWEADVALVAVARPGDFADPEGERCVGLQPLDDFGLGRGTREQVSEVLWPDLIAQDAWDAVFVVGANEVHAALAAAEPDGSS